METFFTELKALAGVDDMWAPLFGLGVLSLLVGTVAAYFQDKALAGKRGFLGFLRYCFPSEFFQKTSFLDICCSVAIYPLLIMPMALAKLGLTLVAGHYQSAAMGAALGQRVAAHAPAWAGPVGSLAAVLCTDFGIFTAHYFMHKSRVLWEFHKMHHSATVLIPFTINRAHPVEDMLETAFSRLYFGIVLGTFSYLFQIKLPQITIYGFGWFVILNFLCCFHLRHSHFYLRYPAWLGRIFYSPAAHQLHHSTKQQHWDLNFGHTLSIWDHLFGTYINDIPETRSFGVGLSDVDPRDYDRVWKLYCLPFTRVRAMVRREGWSSLFSVRRFWYERPKPSLLRA